MSKFDEFMDDFLYHAKNVADVAGKKTGEMVDFSKIKYQIKQTEWEIDKTYAKLGAIVYESKKSTENFDEVIALAVSEVDALQERLEELEDKIRAYKKVVKCGTCGKENGDTAFYCIRCGSPLAEEREEAGEADAAGDNAGENQQDQ